MTVQLDHLIVPSRDQVAGAKRLAELLGVRWAEKSIGPFSAVYVNDGLTMDFINSDEPALPIHHYCFRVTQAEFDAILARIQAAGIPYRSEVHGPVNMQVSQEYGNVYWNEPDGHYWEMLTASYARPHKDRDS
jgi:hypothetical protein